MNKPEKYLVFNVLKELPKTHVYEVKNRLTGVPIATIRWYGPWRKYTLQPLSDTIWNTGCLKEVADFIDELMRGRKVDGYGKRPEHSILE